MKKQQIDLNKYLGVWYEQARYYNFFERKCACDISAQYTLLDDGTVEVLNSCRKVNGEMIKSLGVARIADADDVTFKVAFVPPILRWLPFLWANYTVLHVDTDYQMVIIGEPSKKFFWFLTRQKKASPQEVERAITLAKEFGYDTSKFIYSN